MPGGRDALFVRRQVVLGVLVWVLMRPTAGWTEAPRAFVTLDWSRVNQTQILACGLSHLRNLTLQRIIEEKYAVLERSLPDDIAVTLRSDGPDLVVSARWGELHRLRRVDLAASCRDESLDLEIMHVIVGLVNDIHAARGLELKAKAESKPTLLEASPDQIEWRVSASLSMPNSLRGSLALWMDAALSSSWWLGGGLELGVSGFGPIWIWDPKAGIRLAHRWNLGDQMYVGSGLEVMGLLHTAFRDGVSNMHVDARLAAPLVLGLDGWNLGIEVAPFVRFVETTHVSGDTILHVVRNFGVLARISYVLR